MSKNNEMLELPEFFISAFRKRLFGVFHYPVEKKGIPHKRPAIICCAPIFEEKLHSHRILVNFSRYAVGQGFPVLRFDYFGDGESDGLFEQASLSTRINDIKSAIHIAKEKFGTSKVFLLGLRMGASLAILSSEIVKDDVCGLIACAPIIDVKTYILNLLRGNLSWQMVVHKKILFNKNELAEKIMRGDTVNVEGYEIGRPLFEDCLDIDIRDKIEAVSIPTLILEISPLGEKSKQFQMLCNTFNNTNVEAIAIQEREFWKPQKIVYPACTGLFTTTINWLMRLC